MTERFSMVLILVFVFSGCTAAPPPAAPTPTALVLPSLPATAVPTATATVLPPTLELPMVEIPTATVLPPTPTLEPTPTSGGMTMNIVSDSGGPSLPQPSAASLPGCQRPLNWVRYTVRANDTLSSLGQSTGIGWQRIQDANCLGSTLIIAGQPLYLPFIPQPAPGQANPSSGLPAVPPPNPPPVLITTPEILPAVGPSSPDVTVTPPLGQPGAVFIFRVSGFDAYEQVTIRVIYAGEAKPLDPTAVDASGNLAYFYASPQDASPGKYTVDISGSANAASGSFNIQ